MGTRQCWFLTFRRLDRCLPLPEHKYKGTRSHVVAGSCKLIINLISGHFHIHFALSIPSFSPANMKFSTVALVLAATAEAVPQFGGGKSEWTFVGKKDVKPKYRANAKRQILSYGPIVLYGKDVREAKTPLMS